MKTAIHFKLVRTENLERLAIRTHLNINPEKKLAQNPEKTLVIPFSDLGWWLGLLIFYGEWVSMKDFGLEERSCERERERATPVVTHNGCKRPKREFGFCVWEGEMRLTSLRGRDGRGDRKI